MSKEKHGKFKYPCVYTVKISNKPTFWYSSKKEQFFGLPKIIWGNGHSGITIDEKGEFGLTEFGYGIVDQVKNLPKIRKALQSEKFLTNYMNYEKGCGHAYDKNIIKNFRKDFWKEFI